MLCGSHALAADMFILCLLQMRFRGTDVGNDQKTRMKCFKLKCIFTGKKQGFTFSKYNVSTY